ncbi:M28 family peptidase [Arenibacter sp. GZD96]|uniref:M28 family peptidase n=1 Tax=Aurantibrevibacter litoralis TaxID=3106030 RepID=UPI002AFFF0EB|nr:M28 family peptidase [Arenibacter sp. GZD-96]MEA1786189.1 M28 family peptidase [Arenibacter sp. GZD-96]
MKKIILLVGLVIGCNSSQKTVDEIVKNPINSISSITFAESITEAELKDYLYTYASDEFEGRETGKPGQKKAVEFLKAVYQRLGVPAAQQNGDYFQDVPLTITKLPTGFLKINGEEFPIGDDFIGFLPAKDTYSSIVYAGYGIEDENYSDYAGLDLEGKMVLVKLGEPVNSDGTYTVTGTNEKSVWSNPSESIGKRLEVVSGKGAKGMIYYDAENYNRFKSRFEMMSTQNQDRMSLKNDENSDFAYFFVAGSLAKTMFPAIDTDHSPKEIPLALETHLESNNDDVQSENVVAFLKGSELPEEYVVISSHLDHIGISNNGDINNGADDDGSGTVALLEIAEAFKKAADAGYGPKRSVVFLHVTGEEKGLLGSQYYTDIAPIFPLEQTVANLNIDMIGRIDPKRKGERNYIYLIGSDKLSTELHELSEEVNKIHTKIELDYTYNDVNDPNRFYYRSDHYNFAKNNIPVIFYFNGTHDDYHRPGDTPDKINYDLLENRTRLIFYTAWEIANREKRLIVDKSE